METRTILPDPIMPAGAALAEGRRVELSAVVPLYNEVESVATLVATLTERLAELTPDYEIILIDDGSTDGTAAEIARAEQADPSVRGVYLARNYGQSTAMQAGFDHARGRLVVTLDGDLQNDPADIGRMLDCMAETDADLVSGWRRERQDGWLRVRVSQIANRLISRITGVPLHDYGCSLKLYRGEFLQNIRIYGELHRFLPAVLAEVGGKVTELPVGHHPRRFGRSKYGLDRTLRVLLDLLLIWFLHRFKHRPLHFFGGIGTAAFVPGLLIALYLTVLKLAFGQDIGDRPLLILSVFLMITGLSFIGQGLIGEILVRVLHEPSGRRQYLLRPSARPPAAGRGRSD